MPRENRIVQARVPIEISARTDRAALVWVFELRTVALPSTHPAFYYGKAVLPVAGRRRPDEERAWRETAERIRRECAEKLGIPLDEVPTLAGVPF